MEPNEMIGSNLGHIKPTMPNSILRPDKIHPFEDGDDSSFSKMLKDSIQSINQMQKGAVNQVEKLAKGEIKDVHQVMIAMQEASLTFKMMMKVRTQILAAYKEISKG